MSLPSSNSEAMADPKWKKDINEEMKVPIKNGKWEFILPNGKSCVGSKCVSTVKHKADGLVERCKAQLLARGLHKHMGWIARRFLQWLQKA